MKYQDKMKKKSKIQIVINTTYVDVQRVCDSISKFEKQGYPEVFVNISIAPTLWGLLKYKINKTIRKFKSKMKRIWSILVRK